MRTFDGDVANVAARSLGVYRRTAVVRLGRQRMSA